MANAKKCDRCGTYYDDNYGDTYIYSGNNSIMFNKIATVITNEGYSRTTQGIFDLCKDCHNSFIDWFESANFFKFDKKNNNEEDEKVDGF